MNLPRLAGRIQARLRQITSKEPTWGSLSAAVLTTVMFIVVALSPSIRTNGGSWLQLDSWKNAIKITWPAVLAAGYLKISEKWRRANVWNKQQIRRRTSRKLLSSRGLRQLSENLRSGKVAASDMQSVREAILEAAALSVEAILNPLGHSFSANLLDFSNGTTSKMHVTARSDSTRPIKILYDSERLAAWAAIRDGRIVVVDDVAADPRWDGVGRKSYRSVAAVPVTIDGKAYGAISLDSEEPYQFYGRAFDIALQLEPYAIILALTYPPEAVHHECKYDATRA